MLAMLLVIVVMTMMMTLVVVITVVMMVVVITRAVESESREVGKSLEIGKNRKIQI